MGSVHYKNNTPILERLLYWSIPCPMTGCRLWEGNANPKGYGKFSNTLAHRAMWVEVNGPIPTGKMILHRCDTPACIEPSHLYVGDALSNARDRDNRGRDCRGERRSKIVLESEAHQAVRLRQRGENHPSSRISDEQIRAIRARPASDKNVVIAHEYGLTRDYVGEIRAGKARINA